MKAIITTDKQVYNLYLSQEGLTPKEAKQIARKSDLDETVFDEIVDLDPRENVTEWVRDRIKSKSLENN